MYKLVGAALLGAVTALSVSAMSSSVESTEGQRGMRTSAEAVYFDTGWETLTGVESINDEASYTINFGSDAALAEFSDEAQNIAVHLENATGADFTVSNTLYKDGTPTCVEVPQYTLTLRYKDITEQYNALGWGINCVASGNGSVWGGWAYFNSAWWDEPNLLYQNDTSNTSALKNVVTHEVGHIMGLSHPNETDENGDIWGDCVSEGVQPIMCVLSNGAPGGYLSSANAGKLTSYDIDGLQYLVSLDDM